MRFFCGRHERHVIVMMDDVSFEFLAISWFIRHRISYCMDYWFFRTVLQVTYYNYRYVP
jgi:hypothetical protein